jgi:hypothetical protein
MEKDQSALTDLRTTNCGPIVTLPDSTSIPASHSGQLPLHASLSSRAQKAHVLRGITNLSLISLGQLCDDDCIAVLDKNHLQVFRDNTCILTGTRNLTDGLWDIPLSSTSATDSVTEKHQVNAIIRQINTVICADQPKSPLLVTNQNQVNTIIHQINAILRKDQSKSTLIQYLYACCGSPVVSTWKQAIKNGNFIRVT